MRLVLCVVSVLLLASCKQEAKKPHIEINKMKFIMWDLVKAGEWDMYIVSSDSTKRNKREDVRLYAQVFAIHGITREQYFDSYKYYEAHPVEFKILIDSIDAYSAREKSKLNEVMINHR